MKRWKQTMTHGLMIAAAALLLAGGTAVAGGREKKVAAKDLPKAVSEAVAKLCPGGTILSAEMETEGKGAKAATEYDVKVKLAGGKTVEVEVVLASDGSVKKSAIDSDEDDDDDDDGDKDDDDGDDDDGE